MAEIARIASVPDAERNNSNEEEEAVPIDPDRPSRTNGTEGHIAATATANTNTTTTSNTFPWLDEYRKECAKARARSVKFGTEYKEPNLESFAPSWTELRRVQHLLGSSSSSGPVEAAIVDVIGAAEASVGFATGMDLDSPDEINKQQARRERFGNARAGAVVTTEASTTTAAAPEAKTDAGGGGDAVDATGPSSTNVTGTDEPDAAAGVTVDEAWDNDDNVHQFRIDPPTAPSNTSLADNKIHVFSIDWASFKQVRSDDLLQHFALYGPTYVEWLSDLSANVVFQDKYSAKRALQYMAAELPSPPPPPVPANDSDNDDDDKLPPLQRLSPDVDLGAMGWRIGTTLLVKRTNDRHGRRGTSSRILVRPATALDFLKDRPNSWPAPPSRFSSQKVLVPLRHHHRRRRKQRTSKAPPTGAVKRTRPSPQTGGEKVVDDDNAATTALASSLGGEHPMLSRGLASGRNGGRARHAIPTGTGEDDDNTTAERPTKRFKSRQNKNAVDGVS